MNFLTKLKHWWIFHTYSTSLEHRVLWTIAREHLVPGTSKTGEKIYVEFVVERSVVLLVVFDERLNILDYYFLNTDEAKLAKQLSVSGDTTTIFGKYDVNTDIFARVIHGAFELAEKTMWESLCWVFGESYPKFKHYVGDYLPEILITQKEFDEKFKGEHEIIYKFEHPTVRSILEE